MRSASWYREQADTLLARAAAAEKIEKLADDHRDGTVLRFNKKHTDGVRLTYLALKVVTPSWDAPGVNERWYLTGRAGQSKAGGFSWSQLLDFVGLDDVDTIEIVSGWKSLFTEEA